MRFILALVTALTVSLPTFAAEAGKPFKQTNFYTDRTTTGSTTRVAPIGADRTFSAFGSTSSGSGAATIYIEGADHEAATDGEWKTLGIITLTLGTTVTNDGFASDAAWRFVRARISAISGTNAKVTVNMGSAQ